MPQVDKEVEDMEKFMTVLMDVKVALAKQTEKLDHVLDIKKKVDNTYDTAQSADRRSKDNSKDIGDLEEDLKTKADKGDVERIVKDKDNWKKNLPAWVAVAISAIALLLPHI
ncbi:hypothetical protein [Halobacillus sp. A5]|uniref:hypothetical protein n=1 Tax=Halobacillus sp. A5 TaxID=2880263 RepID=UPI0020A627A6|nr:hypothetical protein [Halobacillus sp. A5]MCP3026595.1 hypothetical protein [Halobacillus sp. A5]